MEKEFGEKRVWRGLGLEKKKLESWCGVERVGLVGEWERERGLVSNYQVS